VALTPAQAPIALPAAKPIGTMAATRSRLAAFWRRPVVRAITRAVVTVWIAITLAFWLIRLMPGSPVEIKIEELTRDGAMTYEEAAVVASTLFSIDLDAPLHEQYLEFMRDVARGDLGSSFLSRGTSVMSIILSVLPWTLFAVGTGLLLSFTVGIGLGLLAAYRRNSVFDHVASSLGSVVGSIPNYLLALMLILFLGVQTRLVPITQMRGAYTPGIQPGFTPEFIGDVLFHAIMPISVFFLTTIGYWILTMRAATLAMLEEDHVLAARARGLPDGRITTAYVGRNAMLPLISQFAIAGGAAIGGSVLIELYFVYQGMGLRLIKAIEQRDYPVMQGILLVTTVTIVTANLITDLIYAKLDPRIGRAGGASG
jgi:peptide/nickel transport system permease protein